MWQNIYEFSHLSELLNRVICCAGRAASTKTNILSAFFLHVRQHLSRWEGLLAVPRRWSSTCRVWFLLFMKPLGPQPSLCSRDAGGVSLLKMLFHFLLDLWLSQCIKGLHLDRESAMRDGPSQWPPEFLPEMCVPLTSAKSCALFPFSPFRNK